MCVYVCVCVAHTPGINLVSIPQYITVYHWCVLHTRLVLIWLVWIVSWCCVSLVFSEMIISCANKRKYGHLFSSYSFVLKCRKQT